MEINTDPFSVVLTLLGGTTLGIIVKSLLDFSIKKKKINLEAKSFTVMHQVELGQATLEYADRLRQDIENLKKENQSLRQELIKISKEFVEIREQIDVLMKENSFLREQLNLPRFKEK